jgi:Undecaprenyl-phosphate glucose phosphotransferase
MISLRPKRPILYLGGDMLTLTLTLIVSLYFFKDEKFSKLEWVILSGFIILWLIIVCYRTVYNSDLDKDFKLLVSTHLKAYSTFIVLLLFFYFLFPFSLPNKSGIIAIVVQVPVLSIATNFFLIKLASWLKTTKGNTKYTLVAGVGNVAKNVEQQLFAHRVPGRQIKGFIDCLEDEECTVGKDKVVGSLTDIQQYLQEHPVDEIVIALPGTPSKKIQNIISIADYHGIRVKYIPDYQEIFGRNYKFTRYGEIDAVNIRQTPLDGQYASFIKNSFDKIFSAIALVLLFPILLAIAILIKLDSPGPVFYCPIRIGKGGKAFKVFKFRSMRENDTPSGGTLSTQKDDPRVTKLGKILRKYSLDELPQFINVFLGDMSVVGPRPHRRYLNQQLQETVYKYMIRHYIKPGITGWAQVNGWRGPTDTDEQKRQRTLHDLWYMENWSFGLDVKIIILTIFSRKTHKIAF